MTVSVHLSITSLVQLSENLWKAIRENWYFSVIGNYNCISTVTINLKQVVFVLMKKKSYIINIFLSAFVAIIKPRVWEDAGRPVHERDHGRLAPSLQLHQFPDEERHAGPRREAHGRRRNHVTGWKCCWEWAVGGSNNVTHSYINTLRFSHYLYI